MVRQANLRQPTPRLIHTLLSALNIDDEEYRSVILPQYSDKPARSSKDLRPAQLKMLVHELEQRAIKSGVWKSQQAPAHKGRRPHNMDRRGSRADQLGKIEALLTVGQKPWAYADSLAKRICKVDSIAFVPDTDLYKIITALRKQAKREGWDLSGER